MCGFVLHLGHGGMDAVRQGLETILHRGPDDAGEWQDPGGACAMAHRRLSILDLSAAGRQPMADDGGRFHVVFNGEIYNYLELRAQLSGKHRFHTGTDTEVLLAAYAEWGEACLHRFIGMFAFAVWDTLEQTLFAARDRFGVKPLFYGQTPGGALVLGSEIKCLHAMGVPVRPDAATWSGYLRDGMYDQGAYTFWEGVSRLPPGHLLRALPGEAPRISKWYDPAARVLAAGWDERSDMEVAEEAWALLRDSVRLRFRADVPVGVCLSGGLDSSLLLHLIRELGPRPGGLQAFTACTGDVRYDEMPWVRRMVGNHGDVAVHECLLTVGDVPALADRMQGIQDEPFSGIPNLAMAMLHQKAKALGVTVLLDGNGVDEGWAGYEYYGRATEVPLHRGPVQGGSDNRAGASVLRREFAGVARPVYEERPFADPLRNLQVRDLMFSKIPRAMRFADRLSMMASRELREPFLDHRLMELGLRQPESRKIRDGQGKWLIRHMAGQALPASLALAPKRAVQTPQREWLQGPLADWAEARIEAGLRAWGADWLVPDLVRARWRDFREQGSDNSFPIWQWINLGLMSPPNQRG
jgi:asparagine synthase (glutamine-hydrolysing)